MIHNSFIILHIKIKEWKMRDYTLLELSCLGKQTQKQNITVSVLGPGMYSYAHI